MKRHLVHLVACYPDLMISDVRACRALLRDACPHDRLETSVLIQAVESRLAEDMRTRDAGPAGSPVRVEWATRLRADSGVSAELALWAIGSWADAVQSAPGSDGPSHAVAVDASRENDADGPAPSSDEAADAPTSPSPAIARLSPGVPAPAAADNSSLSAPAPNGTGIPPPPPRELPAPPPPAPPPPQALGPGVDPAAPFCPRCGARARFVPSYHRYYCETCRRGV